MALIKEQLKNALKNIADNPPETHAEAADLWAQAIVDYASNVIPPSSGVSALKSALVGVFTGAFSSVAAAPLMEPAMTTFGAGVGAGMAPAFVAVPPAGPVGFALLWVDNTDDTDQAADELASAIDTWMRTGTATAIAPGSVPVFWS